MWPSHIVTMIKWQYFHKRGYAAVAMLSWTLSVRSFAQGVICWNELNLIQFYRVCMSRTTLGWLSNIKHHWYGPVLNYFTNCVFYGQVKQMLLEWDVIKFVCICLNVSTFFTGCDDYWWTHILQVACVVCKRHSELFDFVGSVNGDSLILRQKKRGGVLSEYVHTDSRFHSQKKSRQQCEIQIQSTLTDKRQQCRADWRHNCFRQVCFQ